MSGLRHADLPEVNEFLVFDFVRGQEETTRTEIERSLGLSPASVSRIVNRLAESGLVTLAKGETTAPGRPRTRVRFNNRAGAVIAIDLGGTKCHGALADLAGVVLDEDVRPTGASGSPYGTLLACLRALSKDARVRDLPVKALAVGIPAVIDPDTGHARQAPNVHWENFDIVGRLTVDAGVPVMVDNDVNLAALGHAWRGDGVNARDFVVISIGTGIGAGVVIDGQLVKGRHNAAGEVGALLVRSEQLGSSFRDGLGGFERVASGPAIERRARQLLDEGAMASILAEGPATPEAVFMAAAAGDPLATIVIEEVLDAIALALISISAVIDPERIVLDGGVSRSLPPYLDALAERIGRHLSHPPELRVSQLGPNATVVGAIAAALQHTRRAPVASQFAESFGLNA